MRRPAWLRRAASLIAAGALGCSSDDAVTYDPPTPPTALSIEALRPAGGAAWTPGTTCLARGSDLHGTVSVEIGPHPEESGSVDVGLLRDFALRPRWYCAGIASCGYVHLSAGSSVVEAASTFIDLPLADEPDGPLVIRAELRDPYGAAILVGGAPLFAEASVVLAPSCP